MAQILDPTPPSDPDIALCCYVNATSKIQIARITNVPDWYFERVVFPGQRLMFEAVETAMLEIHTGMMASSILSDTIPCKRLLVDAEVPSPPAQPSPVQSSSTASAEQSLKPLAVDPSEALPVGAALD